MITSSLLYLFIIAGIGTLFGYLKQKSQFKIFSSHIYNMIFIVVFTSLLSLSGLFAHTKEIEGIYLAARNNLLPAMLFLIFIDFDFKALLKASNIGCSCSIGPKRYWFILIFSLLVSFISQLISLHVSIIHPFFSTVILSALFGVVASLTPMKTINGIKDIATTMLYLLAALISSQII